MQEIEEVLWEHIVGGFSLIWQLIEDLDGKMAFCTETWTWVGVIWVKMVRVKGIPGREPIQRPRGGKKLDIYEQLKDQCEWNI